jgi:type I restriction enzyme S subunit
MSEVIERKLSDIGCEFISGFGFKSSDYINTGIPLIKIGNIQNRIVSVDQYSASWIAKIQAGVG